MPTIWTLSLDKNIGSQRQVTALARALGKNFAKNDISIKNFIALIPENATSPKNNVLMTWPTPLKEDELKQVSFDQGKNLEGPWPDIVISCRPEVAALALSIKAASNNKTQIIQIQSPNDTAGNYNFKLEDFDLVVKQPQEQISGKTVMSSQLAIHDLTPSIIKTFNKAVLKTSNRSMIGILVGGTDEYLTIDEEMIRQFAEDIRDYADQHAVDVQILTSRRTGEAQTDVLKSVLGTHPHITIDNPKINYNTLIGTADSFIVTGESMSMISEPLATGKSVSIHDFKGILKQHPMHETLEKLLSQNIIKKFDPKTTPAFSSETGKPYDELPTLSQKIKNRLKL